MDRKTEELQHPENSSEDQRITEDKIDQSDGTLSGQDVLNAIKSGANINPDILQKYSQQSTENEQIPIDDSWQLKSSDLNDDAQDPLVSCLVGITRLYGRPLTADSIKSGLPIGVNGMTRQSL